MKQLTLFNGYYADCYVFVENRLKETIYSFLEKYFPNRKELAMEYEVPQYSDEPIMKLKSALELIDYMIDKPMIYIRYIGKIKMCQI